MDRTKHSTQTINAVSWTAILCPLNCDMPLVRSLSDPVKWRSLDTDPTTEIIDVQYSTLEAHARSEDRYRFETGAVIVYAQAQVGSVDVFVKAIR